MSSSEKMFDHVTVGICSVCKHPRVTRYHSKGIQADCRCSKPEPSRMTKKYMKVLKTIFGDLPVAHAGVYVVPDGDE